MNQEKEIYKIPTYRMDKFRSDVRSMNRRAAKLGVEGIVYQEHGTELIRYKETTPGGTYIERSYEVVLVTVDGPIIELAGWQFIACIDHVSADENIIIADNSIPNEYRTAKAKCEHCNSNRTRHKTYIVQHGTHGYKQVGSGCLKDFTGHKSAESIAALAARWWEFDPGDYEEFEGGCGRVPPYVDLKSVVIISHYLIRTKGFISKTRANESYMLGRPLTPTVEIIEDHIEPRRDRSEDERIEVDQVDRDAAENIFKWANEIGGDVKSNYMYNIWAIFQSERIHKRFLAFAVAAVNTYLRSLEKKKEYAEFKNEHFGTEKKREEFCLKLLWKKHIPGDYGEITMMKFVDPENRVAIWFNSGSPFLSNGYRSGDEFFGEVWTEGMTYKVKATVKRHDQYNEMAQTVLSRVVWLETIENGNNSGDPSQIEELENVEV